MQEKASVLASQAHMEDQCYQQWRVFFFQSQKWNKKIMPVGVIAGENCMEKCISE